MDAAVQDGMNLLRLLRSPLPATAVGLCAWAFAANASAAFGACEVPLMTNPEDAAIKLQNCVDAVNAPGWQSPTEITFEGSQSYALDNPLVLERDVVIHGEGQILVPASGFADESLITVGTPCPGSSCGGAISVTIEGIEIDGTGSTDIRGIDLLGSHELLLKDAYVHDLQTTTSGTCLRAAPTSLLTLDAGFFATCITMGDGGGLFTEATVTVIDGVTFVKNEAGRGGGVYFGGSASASRKLRIWDSSFKQNEATDGGAIYTHRDATNTQVSDSTFLLNRADRHGGGFFGGGDFFETEFKGNTARDSGGGAFLQTGSFVYGSAFDGNAAINGGGVTLAALNSSFEMEMAHSTVWNNRGNVAAGATPGKGAGVFIDRQLSSGNLIHQLRNCTISSNVMDAPIAGTVGGGVAVNGVITEFEHVTPSNNDADSGRAIHAAQNAVSRVSILSSIAANTPDPANPTPGPVCRLGPLSITETSLDTDGSCGVAYSAVDPELGPLLDNGGPTPTHLAFAPAVRGTAECFEAYDQRGVARPTTGCDVGAIQL